MNRRKQKTSICPSRFRSAKTRLSSLIVIKSMSSANSPGSSCWLVPRKSTIHLNDVLYVNTFFWPPPFIWWFTLNHDGQRSFGFDDHSLWQGLDLINEISFQIHAQVRGQLANIAISADTSSCSRTQAYEACASYILYLGSLRRYIANQYSILALKSRQLLVRLAPQHGPRQYFLTYCTLSILPSSIPTSPHLPIYPPRLLFAHSRVIWLGMLRGCYETHTFFWEPIYFAFALVCFDLRNFLALLYNSYLRHFLLTSFSRDFFSRDSIDLGIII